MKKSVNYIAAILVGMLLVYVCSYAALRMSVMHFAANRRDVGGQPIIKTWVYFGDGDNFATHAASAAYLPMIHLEYHFSRVIVYE
jgi:hypothetical protein